MPEKVTNRWLIAAAGVVMQIALGAVYAWSVFRKPLSEEYDASVSTVNIAFTLTIVFLGVTVTLLPFSIYGVAAAGQGTPVTVTVLTALLVCLIPTTIGGLLSAIGIAGMDRMIQANVIATSGRAVEAAGDVDVLLLDKTGTITLGNRQATEFLPAEGIGEARFADAARWNGKRHAGAARRLLSVSSDRSYDDCQRTDQAGQLPRRAGRSGDQSV